MGNCLFGGLGDPDGSVIKVITSNGGVMEFFAPITAGSIAGEFPGHGIFRSRDLFWKPLRHPEDLVAGQSYYLLPLNVPAAGGGELGCREGHVRSSSIPENSLVAPYRMSLDYQGMLKRSYTDVFSTRSCPSHGVGFWKVKLVISPEQLLEILSQEGRTQELIENVRTVAKCSNSTVPTLGFSDQWSLSSSSRNASSSVDGLVDIIS